MTTHFFKIKNQARLNFGRDGFFSLFIIISLVLIGCSGSKDTILPPPVIEEEEIVEEEENELVEGVDYFLPKIDLNNWKVTLPVGNPSEIKPPAILDYASNASLTSFMYNDSTDASLVFETYPGASTANSSYSRTELREQMVPGSDKTNWTFKQGGRLKGTLAVTEISKDANGKDHRTIIMQIHGRLTDEQRDLIGEDDNNAPPMLKIYWHPGGKVRVLTKELKDLDVSDTDILKTSSWKGDDGFNFNTIVGHEKFTLEVIVSEGRMEVILNDTESKVYEGIHMEKWGVFENYFKAGNYLQTKDEGSFAKVKYYELEVEH